MEKVVELVHKGVYIPELTVNRGKSDISDLVDTLELIHGKLADLKGRNLSVERTLKRRLDFIHGLFEGFKRNGTLFAGAHKAVYKLCAVELLAGFVPLDHNYGKAFHHLIGCETLFAGKAFSPAAYAGALVGGTGIYNLAFFISAKRTSHVFLPACQD